MRIVICGSCNLNQLYHHEQLPPHGLPAAGTDNAFLVIRRNTEPDLSLRVPLP